MAFVLDDVLRGRFEIQVNCLSYVVKGFIASASLGPAAFQRWAVSGEVAVLAAFDYNLECHGSMITRERFEVNLSVSASDA